MSVAVNDIEPRDAIALAERSTGRRRNEALDIARLLAALAIIWIHAGLHTGTLVARFAVPFFACVAVYFVADKASRESLARWPRWAAGRAARLYLPFLAWSGVYLAFKLAKKTLAPEQPNDFGGWEMLIWGGAYHLWFLPFLLVVSVAAFPLVRFAGRCWSLLFGLAVTLACCPCPAFWPAHDAARCVWDALPSALAGCAWGMVVFLPAVRPRCCCAAGERSRRLAWQAGLLMFAASMGLLVYWGRSNLLETAAGLGLGVAAVNWPPMPLPHVLAALGRVSLGIYCAHLLFVKIGESVAAKLHVPATPSLDVVLFISAAIASAACAWVLSRSRATGWLVA